jgi:alkanesulfonate monooxygenase SsuD/methylene tetrahydromethanopterin reductase-like flavin-dependent oxidoreductase (luciferase family)
MQVQPTRAPHQTNVVTIEEAVQLFSEKLELLLQLNATERVTWQGRFRPALHDAEIAPRPLQAQLPI